jgi:hypothetical protein
MPIYTISQGITHQLEEAVTTEAEALEVVTVVAAGGQRLETHHSTTISLLKNNRIATLNQLLKKLDPDDFANPRSKKQCKRWHSLIFRQLIWWILLLALQIRKRKDV